MDAKNKTEQVKGDLTPLPAQPEGLSPQEEQNDNCIFPDGVDDSADVVIAGASTAKHLIASKEYTMPAANARLLVQKGEAVFVGMTSNNSNVRLQNVDYVITAEDVKNNHLMQKYQIAAGMIASIPKFMVQEMIAQKQRYDANNA